MAKGTTAEPGERLEDAAERSQSPDLDLWRRLSVEVAMFLQPEAAGCRFVIDVPNAPDTVYGIPMVGNVAGAERKVIAFVEKFPPDEWVKGRTIAAEIEMEYGGGQFGKLMSELVKVKKLLESDRSQGYRLKRL